jgi:predicted nucleic acid binding AN1-type Zn finger protein
MQNQIYFEKIFSTKRMQRYFDAHKANPNKAMLHYQCNIELAESFYSYIAVFEVALRNALNRELIALAGRNDWYVSLFTQPGMSDLHKYITQANKQITNRKEIASPDKIVAELTLGFWVSLLNSKYEKLLWKDLRRAFPYMPKTERQRKNISAPLNSFRAFRNRVFHHEPICWNMNVVRKSTAR